MAKMLAYDEEARQKLVTGVTKLAKAVRCTLGPRRGAMPSSTKGGVVPPSPRTA